MNCLLEFTLIIIVLKKKRGRRTKLYKNVDNNNNNDNNFGEYSKSGRISISKGRRKKFSQKEPTQYRAQSIFCPSVSGSKVNQRKVRFYENMYMPLQRDDPET